MKTLPSGLSLILLLGAPAILMADVINFEGLPDSTVLTNQYAASEGLTLSNAIILTAGISLNEFDFPPYSGSNVASDYTGPMSISFASPVSSFGGYFTYTEPVTIDAFGASGNPLGSATSAFSENFASCSGSGCNPNPNEFIAVSSAAGISDVTITGDPSGGSFALDNATFTVQSTTALPEPSYDYLLLLGVVMFGIVNRRKMA